MTIVELIGNILWMSSVLILFIVLYRRQRKIEKIIERSVKITTNILDCNKNLADINEKIINALINEEEPKETKNERNKKK